MKRRRLRPRTARKGGGGGPGRSERKGTEDNGSRPGRHAESATVIKEAEMGMNKYKTETGVDSFLMSVLVLVVTTVWIDVIEVSDAISLSSSAVEVFGKDLSAGFCDFVYPSAYLSLLLLCPLIVCYYMLERTKWRLISSEIAAAIWVLLCMYILIKFAKNPDLLVVNALIFEDLYQYNPVINMEPEVADEYLSTKRKIKLAMYDGQFAVRWIAFSVIAVEFIIVALLFINMSSLKALKSNNEEEEKQEDG